jgi:site-specific recombinase XerD
MTEANDAETYEQRVHTIQQANQAILNGFETWLRQSGLSEQTITDHIDNIRFFSRYLLVYAYSLRRLNEATEGAVYDFLEDWFPRHALWASVSSMKVYLASFKKFFTWMGATGLVAPAIVEDVLSTLKDDRNLFLSRVAEEFPNGEARKWLDEKLVPPPSEKSD